MAASRCLPFSPSKGNLLSSTVSKLSVTAIMATCFMLGALPIAAQGSQSLRDEDGRSIGDVRYLPLDAFLGLGASSESPPEEPVAPVLPATPEVPPMTPETPVVATPSPDWQLAPATEENDTFDLGDHEEFTLSDPGGNDTITSTISRDLEDFPDIEHLTLLGAAHIDGSGNVKANRLIGNSGNNVLIGRGGADYLAGGEGDDTYVLEAATNDTIEDSAGIDTITSTISRDLRDFVGIENLELTFSAHVDGYGDDGPNHLRGNDGKNTLDGRGGDDVIDGGKGPDTLTGGPGKDRFVLSDIGDTKTAAGHRDIINDFKSGEDRIDLSAVAPPAGLVFIGEGDFSKSAGEVRWFKKNKDWLILAIDINGDGEADAEIEIAPVRRIVPDDLIL